MERGFNCVVGLGLTLTATSADPLTAIIASCTVQYTVVVVRARRIAKEVEGTLRYCTRLAPGVVGGTADAPGKTDADPEQMNIARKKENEARFVQQVATFVIVLVVLRIWSIVLRFYEYANGVQLPFFVIMHAFFTPLQGFVNTFIYGFVDRDARAWIRDKAVECWQCCRRR